MITELYDKDTLSGFLSSRKKYIILSISVLVFAIVASVLISFFVNDANQIWFEVLNIVVCAFGGWLALFWLFNKILPFNSYIRNLRLLLFSERKKVCGKVERIGKAITVSKNIEMREIIITDEDETQTVLYWDNNLKLPELVGKDVEFYVVQNKVAAYGVCL